MKAAIALLSDYVIQNVARGMVYSIYRRAGIEFLGSLLPAHVSLKQPFTFENMEALESWFDSFSRRVSPLHIDLDHIYYSEGDNSAFIGFNVPETPMLRALHNQINQELTEVVSDISAPFDGEAYRFHLTIELGRFKEVNPYRLFYEALPDKQANLSFMAENMALFFYADGPIDKGTFICYKVLPLLGTPS